MLLTIEEKQNTIVFVCFTKPEGGAIRCLTSYLVFSSFFSFVLFFRGNSPKDSKAFRSSYGKLGEIPTIAMTATATRDTRKNIADSLGLRNFVLVKEWPKKMNIKHTVYHTKTRDFDDMFKI